MHGKSKKSKAAAGRCRLEKLYVVVGIVVILAAVLGVIGIYGGFFRLDQYAATIFGTTAGVVGSMFGLTAASYAFIWGDLRSDSQFNRHLGKVLEHYRKKLWELFSDSLLLTMCVLVSSLVGLAFVQKATEPDLSMTVRQVGLSLSSCYDEKLEWISLCALFNLIASFAVISIMAIMNYTIFKRNDQYAQIAKEVLDSIDSRYDMVIRAQGHNVSILQDEASEDMNSLEYKKIHNLELLVERILKNHESIGDAFAETQRREKLLAYVIANELTAMYNLQIQGRRVSQKQDKNDQSWREWNCLNDKKRRSRWEQCQTRAAEEYSLLLSLPAAGEESEIKPPCRCGFISVYDDLLGYRDNSLIYEENCSREKRIRINMKDKCALRYTIKRRLLIFYLQGETFSNMDLTGISFSGADLRFTNFSGCNLTGIRLKGANCEGADFTGAKMTGMFFADVERDKAGETGEIELTFYDDSKETWDPYRGREATCLREATFKDADISRAYLKAPGKLCCKQSFPYGELGENSWKVEDDQPLFFMEGTNFDNAKMFFSYFKNIDFTNSSLERAQLYNAGFVQTKAKSANFAYATLTNACIAWCDFENADFTAASLTETILSRVNFHGAKLRDANFSYSNITACNFEGASCQNVSFKNVIQDPDIFKGDLPEALKDLDIFESAEIRFHYAILTNTDFSGAVLDRMSFLNAIGQDCVFTKAAGKNMVFDSSLFASSIFNATRLEGCRFNNTIFRDSVFMKTIFINATFDKVDFSNILLNDADALCFVGGYMREVDFSGARGLTAACFKNIVLCGVNFWGTDIRRCDFLGNVKIDDTCSFEK